MAGDTLTLDALVEDDAANALHREIVGHVVAMLREAAASPALARLRGDDALRVVANELEAALLRTLAEAAQQEPRDG